MNESALPEALVMTTNSRFAELRRERPARFRLSETI